MSDTTAKDLTAGRGRKKSRYERRIQVRLSERKIDHQELLAEYDRRSKKLGKKDQDFLRLCMLSGYALIRGNRQSVSCDVALSDNESHNTEKQHSDVSEQGKGVRMIQGMFRGQQRKAEGQEG